MPKQNFMDSFFGFVLIQGVLFALSMFAFSMIYDHFFGDGFVFSGRDLVVYIIGGIIASVIMWFFVRHKNQE